MNDVESELCRSWSTRCAEYVMPGCGIKRSTPDTSFRSVIVPFKLLLVGSPRTVFDTFVPHMGDTEASGYPDNFREESSAKHAGSPVGTPDDPEKFRRCDHAEFLRRSAGGWLGVGDVVLVCESDSSLHRQEMGSKLGY